MVHRQFWTFHYHGCDFVIVRGLHRVRGMAALHLGKMSATEEQVRQILYQGMQRNLILFYFHVDEMASRYFFRKLSARSAKSQ